MNLEHVRLVRESWSAIAPRGDALARAFYARLFEIAPELRQRFGDMESQRLKFMDMLGEIVRMLDEPEQLVPETAALGRRHVDYGTTDHDYDLARVALLDAFGRELGARFDAAAREAWTEAYSLASAVMRRAAAVRAER